MDRLDFTILLALLLPLILIAGGLIFIFKKDWAWWMVERRHRTINPQRTSTWEKTIETNGSLLIVLGLAFGLFVLVKLLPLLSR